MRSFLLGLFAIAVFSSGAMAAGRCEGAQPNQKFKCCQKHPSAPACR